MDKCAKSLFTRLASYGIPPEFSVAAEELPKLSVGIENWIDRLVEAFLRDLCTEEAHFKLVLAPYGGGKTHFLMALGLRSLQENYAVSFVQCVPDRQGSPARVDNPLGLYGEIANSLRLHSHRSKGIEVLLKAVVSVKRAEIDEAEATDPDKAFRAFLRSLKDEFPMGQYGDFARIVSEALIACWDDRESPTSDAALKYLRGAIEELTPDERRALGVNKLSKSQKDHVGRMMLGALAKFTKCAGAQGIVVLIDELETLFNVKGKALNVLLGAMRAMIDSATMFDQLPLLCVFSATPEILQQFQKYPALEQRLSVGGGTFAQGFDSSPQISLEDLELSQEEMLREIGERVIDIAIAAFGKELGKSLQQKNVEILAKVAAAQHLDVNARRLFVKAWASLLDMQIKQGERPFTESELLKRYRGEFNDIERSDKETVEP